MNLSLNILALAGLSLAFTGCGRQQASGVGEALEHAGSDEKGAAFREGHGIDLSEATRKAIGLQLTEIAVKDLPHEVHATAQVYREAGEKVRPSSHARPGHAYASAMIDSGDAALMKTGQTVRVASPELSFAERQGRLDHIERELDFYTGRTEILIEIPDPENRIRFGSRLQVSLSVGLRKGAVTTPRSALLQASQGDFVYVVNGDYLLRTPVEVGVIGAEEVEIVGGLYPGDRVAVRPVETLWLIELRAVKGGGHSH
jgi:hypothetical protein